MLHKKAAALLPYTTNDAQKSSNRGVGGIKGCLVADGDQPLSVI
ncbi:hypothetical protein [Zoogloea ramigera]|nr:hypothetical protein [Zoogloea ramigera]